MQGRARVDSDPGADGKGPFLRKQNGFLIVLIGKTPYERNKYIKLRFLSNYALLR